MNVAELASDITGATVFLALPALLWLFLYLWAWERPATARAAGFGRRVFWLLLPGCLLGSLADLPLVPWDASILAISFGGALFPILLSVYLPGRWYGPTGYRVIGLAVAVLAGLAAALFALVLVPSGPGFGGLGEYHGTGLGALLDPVPPAVAFGIVVGLAAAIAGLLTARRVGLRPTHPTPIPGRTPHSPVLFFVALASFALLLTYATTEAIAGLGIVSAFPQYLVPPILTGLLAVALVRRAVGLPRVAGLSFGYAAGTFGALIGADVLHEPPLYGGASGFLVIGGAGLLDLVYLTGLLAAATGFLACRVLARFAPVPDDRPAFAAQEPPASVRAELAAADRALERGDATGALTFGLRAAERALDQVRRLRGFPPAAPHEDPLTGLGTPPYVGRDLANLRALVRAPNVSVAEARRGLQMGRMMVGLAEDLQRPLFAPLGRRISAFLVDFTILTAAAILLWVLLIERIPGGPSAVLASVAFEAALLGYVAVVFVYFVLTEALLGTTLGKELLGLEVTNRALERPGLLPSLLRNAPRMIPALIVSEVIGVGLVLVLSTGGGAGPDLGVPVGSSEGAVLLGAGAAGLLLAGAITAATILLSPERERVGDLWAGTWVIPRREAGAPPVPAAVADSPAGREFPPSPGAPSGRAGS